MCASSSSHHLLKTLVGNAHFVAGGTPSRIGIHHGASGEKRLNQLPRQSTNSPKNASSNMLHSLENTFCSPKILKLVFTNLTAKPKIKIRNVKGRSGKFSWAWAPRDSFRASAAYISCAACCYQHGCYGFLLTLCSICLFSNLFMCQSFYAELNALYPWVFRQVTGIIWKSMSKSAWFTTKMAQQLCL